MSRPQFSLKTLLWLTAVVAAFLGGVMLGVKLAGMRREYNTIESYYVNEDGTPAAPGVVTEDSHVVIEPTYPWLQFLPVWNSRSTE